MQERWEESGVEFLPGTKTKDGGIKRYLPFSTGPRFVPCMAEMRTALSQGCKDIFAAKSKTLPCVLEANCLGQVRCLHVVQAVHRPVAGTHDA